MEKAFFTEREKQELTLRLERAAETARVCRWSRKRHLTAAILAAALLLTAAGAASLGGFFTPLFDRTGASLTIDGQALPLEARMTLNSDGTATIEVDGSGETTVITVPEVTAAAMLRGETNAGFAVTRLDGAPYALAEQDGRLWLFVNDRVPLDVTGLLADGYTFTYIDESGEEQTATVSGTPEAYTVQ